MFLRQDRLEKSKQNEAKLENEKRHLLDEIARYEGRSNKLDLQRIALEGDIQRLQMTLQEKENSLRNCQERLDNQQRSSAQVEDRSVQTFSVVCEFNDSIIPISIADVWH